jgi:prepilin-type N-terminal cleavage/methylation domain-containing protein
MKHKLKNRKGFSLLETMLALAILSVVTLPAYMALMSGYKLFDRETKYQSAISDVQIFTEEVNARIRVAGFVAGFKETEHINTTARLDEVVGLRDIAPRNPTNILRIKDTFYYLNDQALYKYKDSTEYKMFENVRSFVIEKPEDGQMLTLKVTVEVNGRQETIETSVFDRY